VLIHKSNVTAVTSFSNLFNTFFHLSSKNIFNSFIRVLYNIIVDKSIGFLKLNWLKLGLFLLIKQCLRIFLCRIISVNKLFCYFLQFWQLCTKFLPKYSLMF
jgi:hypothetical protein